MKHGKHQRKVRRSWKHRRIRRPSDLVEVAAQLPYCWICAGLAEVVGIFVPDQPDLWPGPPLVPGKHRALASGLCNRCKAKPEAERNARVEALLKAGAPC